MKCHVLTGKYTASFDLDRTVTGSDNNINTFIRHKSRLRKYERKTQRQKYYVQYCHEDL